MKETPWPFAIRRAANPFSVSGAQVLRAAVTNFTAMEWFELNEALIHRRSGARNSATQTRQLGFIE